MIIIAANAFSSESEEEINPKEILTAKSEPINVRDDESDESTTQAKPLAIEFDEDYQSSEEQQHMAEPIQLIKELEKPNSYKINNNKDDEEEDDDVEKNQISRENSVNNDHRKILRDDDDD